MRVEVPLPSKSPMPINETELQRHRKARLHALVETEFSGEPIGLARALGHKNSGFVNEMLTGKKSITDKTIRKIESIDGAHGWFSEEAEPSTPRRPMTSTSVYPQRKGATSFPQQGTVSKSFTNITTLVPEVVSWDRIGDVLSMQHHGGEVYSALAMPGQFSRNVQVIQYPDDSLEPEIQPGELIAVDPGIEPWPGDIVVARSKVTGQYFAGRFVSNRSGGFKIRSNKPDRYADADHNDADVVAVMVARLSGRSGTRPVEFKGI